MNKCYNDKCSNLVDYSKEQYFCSLTCQNSYWNKGKDLRKDGLKGVDYIKARCKILAKEARERKIAENLKQGKLA